MSVIRYPFIKCLALLAASLLMVVGGLCSVAVTAERQPRGEALARAIRVQRRHANRLLSVADIVGTATGVTPDGKFALKVYARRPGVPGIPEKLDDVPVVVQVTGEFFALQRSLHRRPPLRPGRRPPWRRDRPPIVLIVSPRDGGTVSGDVMVTALAFDDRRVAGVEFLVDETLLGVDADGSDGWLVDWDTSQVEDGQHTITATVMDTAGQTGSDRVAVVVDNEPGPFSPDGRPSPIGVSTGNENQCSAGTIACRVRDAEGNVYALSNNHVFARLNRARIGEAIVQPGLIDSDCALAYDDQIIGVLAGFVPIDFRWNANNAIDAAIALSTAEDLGYATPPGGYGTPKSAPVEAYVGQHVQKYGRTTLLTKGDVSGLEATVVVNYGNRSARFASQIIVNGAAGLIDAGDSGSLLVTYDPSEPEVGGRDPVGLLYAGNEDGSIAIASPIQTVLDAFEVTIDGQ